jgi:hypothetical protein
MSYRVFVRNWWKLSSSWPNGLEPDGSAKKKVLGIVDSVEEARSLCRDYNGTHSPGRLGRKAEFERVT